MVLVCAVAWAEDVGIRATVDRRMAYIGDRIKYTVEVTSGKETETKFPAFSDDKLGDFEIKDSASKVKKGLFGKKVTNFYYLAAYSVGVHTIPAIEIKYKQKTGRDWLAKNTNPIDIKIESVLPKTGTVGDIKDIKGPIEPFEINWILVLIISIVAGAGLGIFIVYKKMNAMRQVKLPHETALEELEAIKGIFARSANTKEYYVRISDCIRRYIERVFALKAPEMTTEEFLDSLKDSVRLSLEYKALLSNFLSACDLVKFAKYAPTRIEIESVYVTAKNFIEETRNTFYVDI